MTKISASVSSEPSEFSRRKWSPKSSGSSEANKTAPGVPNSMTALSRAPPSPTRATCTGMRTGTASGKNFASFATDESDPLDIATVACFDTELLGQPSSDSSAKPRERDWLSKYKQRSSQSRRTVKLFVLSGLNKFLYHYPDCPCS